MILPVIDNYIPGERKRMTTTIFSDIGGRSGSILVRKGSFPSLSLVTSIDPITLYVYACSIHFQRFFAEDLLIGSYLPFGSYDPFL